MGIYEKPDFWSLKAQKENYPARSVYKLKEIDEKFEVLKFAKNSKVKVLDLGAAPGSWSLYVLRRYGKLFDKTNLVTAGQSDSGHLFLAAVDLLPLSNHLANLNQKDFFFIQGDFTADKVREELVRRGPYNAIICDAAPDTTGSRTVDTLRSFALTENALSCAEQCLAPGGNLVVKVFQGGDTAQLLKRLRDSFSIAKSYKPAVCRSNSFETYYIGMGAR